MKYDLIIIGSGPAGFTAGIYAARYMLKTLILGQLPGGMASEAHKVCNFPSYENITGFELTTKMYNHAKSLGVEIKQEFVDEIEKVSNEFKIKTGQEEYLAKKIIIATGSKRKKLGREREEELTGKGVSYCATCDAGFYKDKVASVVGGGNSALTAALLLSKYAKKVYVIYRKAEFCKAEPAWVEEVKSEPKIEIIYDTNVTRLIGEQKLEKIELDKKGEKSEIKVDGLFIEVGSIPQTKVAEKAGVKLDCKNIEVDKKQKTNVHGIFAAGDVTNNPLKQIITACGEGAVAADSVYKEIIEEK